MPTNKLSKPAHETLKQASTGMVADALALSGIKGGIKGVRPARGFEDAKIIGPAATVLFGPAHPVKPLLNNYTVIRESAPGSILVIDGKGVDGHFTGDNQGLCAKRQGLAGVVVYGGARDIAGYREMAMPLFCTRPATCDKPGEFKLTAYNVAIEIGGVRIEPGDIIVADEDGVVAIPAVFLTPFIENLKRIDAVETDMQKALARDAPLEELAAIIARKKPKSN